MILCRIFTIVAFCVFCFGVFPTERVFEIQILGTEYKLDFNYVAGAIMGITASFGVLEFLLRNGKNWKWLSWLYAIPLVALTGFVTLFDVHQNFFWLYVLLCVWGVVILILRTVSLWSEKKPIDSIQRK
jgi:hypothetical protein